MPAILRQRLTKTSPDKRCAVMSRDQPFAGQIKMGWTIDRDAAHRSAFHRFNRYNPAHSPESIAVGRAARQFEYASLSGQFEWIECRAERDPMINLPINDLFSDARITAKRPNKRDDASRQCAILLSDLASSSASWINRSVGVHDAAKQF